MEVVDPPAVLRRICPVKILRDRPRADQQILRDKIILCRHEVGRPPSWYAERGFRDESDNVLMRLDREEPGWVAFRNLTTAALTLQTALQKDSTS
jgi:hypothetical protein